MGDGDDQYSIAIVHSAPAAYYMMEEASGDVAKTHTAEVHGARQNGKYEDGVVFYLEGPTWQRNSLDLIPVWGFPGPRQEINRCPHFAGGRMATKLANIKNQYS